MQRVCVCGEGGGEGGARVGRTESTVASARPPPRWLIFPRCPQDAESGRRRPAAGRSLPRPAAGGGQRLPAVGKGGRQPLPLPAVRGGQEIGFSM